LYGKVKTMKDHRGDELTDAGPAVPAELSGLKMAPKVGDVIELVDDPKKAKKAKVYRMQKEETFITKSSEETDEDSNGIVLNIILRADVLGSQEAIVESLKKIEKDDIKIKFVSKGLGSVTESDVLSAEATGAVVIGFNALPSTAASDLAKDKKVEILTYKIIYELIDEVKSRLKTLIKPELVRKDLGKMQVLAVFKKGNDWEVIGGKVLEGKIEPDAKIAVLRGSEFVTSGKITELQVGKQEVKDAVKGQECGIKFVGQPLIEENDVLDVYKEEEIYQQL